MDGTAVVLSLGEEFDEAIDGVGRGSAVEAGVEVAAGSGGFDFHVNEAAETDGEGGQTGGVEGGVRDESDVGFELLRVFGDELGDGLAADLLFAFDQEFDIEGEGAAEFAEGFDGLDVGVELALVVGRTAGVDVAVGDDRLKGRGVPEFEGVGGLDVVVAVAEDGGLAGGGQAFGVDERVPRGLNDLHVGQADGAEGGGGELGGAFDVGFVLRQRADARDAEKVQQLVEKPRLVSGYVSGNCVVTNHG